MTKTLTLAAIATVVSTAAFAMVPSNDSIKADIMDLGFSAAEVAQIPADQLQTLNFKFHVGNDAEARRSVKAAVASIIYDGGLSAEELAAWTANNGEASDVAKISGVDFVSNGSDAEALRTHVLTSGNSEDQRLAERAFN